VKLPIIIAYDPSAPQEVTAGARELARLGADAGEGTAILAALDEDDLADLRAWVRARAKPTALWNLEPTQNSVMSAAPFVYRPDGSPDWGSMWQTFCELALYGGPPHRGEDSALTEPAAAGTMTPELLAELQRGIKEVSGLESDLRSESWLAVHCGSKRMAAWMCAAIILENVEARCEANDLLLPAAEGFELTNEVKSLITVIAKVNHYWQAHLMGSEAVSS
jgi:sirohydrochlorin cobaltochelatase